MARHARRCPLFLGDSRDEQEHRENTRHEGEEKESSFLRDPEAQEQCCQNRADEGAGVVHGALKTERPSAAVRGSEFRQERVAWRRPQSLAEPVGEADCQDLGPRSRKAGQRPRHRGDRITEDDERLSPPDPVRPPSRRDLRQRCGGFGEALDETQGGRACPENPRHEVGQQWVDHLGRGVVQERHPSQCDDPGIQALFSHFLLGCKCLSPWFHSGHSRTENRRSRG